MTTTELLEYAQNPEKVHPQQTSKSLNELAQQSSTFISKTVDESYIMGIRHAYNRIDINFMAGVDNETTRQELKDWLMELGVDIDQQYSD